MMSFSGSSLLQTGLLPGSGHFAADRLLGELLPLLQMSSMCSTLNAAVRHLLRNICFTLGLSLLKLVVLPAVLPDVACREGNGQVSVGSIGTSTWVPW